MRSEQKIRDHAAHLALLVRRQGSALFLSERYILKRKLGTFRSWRAVDRALWRYMDLVLEHRGKREPSITKIREALGQHNSVSE
jgi:hypothetical protein